MKQNTKRIIAREGLIILSLILLSVLVSYIGNSLVEWQKINYIANAKRVELAETEEKFKVTYTISGRAVTFNQRPTQDDIFSAFRQEVADWKLWNEWAMANSRERVVGTEDMAKRFKIELIRELIPQGKIVVFPKDTSNYAIEQTIRRDFSYINKVDFILNDKLESWRFVDRYYDSEGNRKFDSFIYDDGSFLLIAFFIPFGAYPLYLLIRFIVWSIKTLKNRTGENE